MSKPIDPNAPDAADADAVAPEATTPKPAVVFSTYDMTDIALVQHVAARLKEMDPRAESPVTAAHHLAAELGLRASGTSIILPNGRSCISVLGVGDKALCALERVA